VSRRRRNLRSSISHTARETPTHSICQTADPLARRHGECTSLPLAMNRLSCVPPKNFWSHESCLTIQLLPRLVPRAKDLSPDSTVISTPYGITFRMYKRSSESESCGVLQNHRASKIARSRERTKLKSPRRLSRRLPSSRPERAQLAVFQDAFRRSVARDVDHCAAQLLGRDHRAGGDRTQQG
jgi:hypothetical protein